MLMQKKLEKYATILLTTCLKIKKGQPLIINCAPERIDFVRIVTKKAYELGVTDIHLILNDPYIKRDQLLHLSVEQMKKSPIWDKSIYNEYAKKDAAFLLLVSEYPNVMKEVDPKKLSTMNAYSLETSRYYNELRDKKVLAWCIAGVATKLWADHVFGKSANSLDKLWKAIFKTCLIDQEDTMKCLEDKRKEKEKRCKKLNSLHIKTLHYKNKLGTDFTIDLPKEAQWVPGETKLQNGKIVLVNYPSEEIFTSPIAASANGVVYSSKPLINNDVIISDFMFEFKNGKVIKCKAKKGNASLQELIKTVKNADRIGEVALVPYDSPISKSNILFYETLYDENASCHIALGSSFPECIVNGEKKKEDELEKIGLNQCSSHVDFMVGTKDLQIIATTYDGKEVQIFNNGNFSEKI